jgi:putative polyketide hydroxylase
MKTVQTPVLIIGGALSGLAAAVFLRSQGCACLLAERHPDTSRHPRARGVNIRTMELMRTVGLEEEVRATESARNLADRGGIAVMESLSGRELKPFEQSYLSDPRAVSRFPSPSSWCLCDQDELERVLRRRATGLGADVRFGTEVTDLTRVDGGYRAVLRPRDGEPCMVAAQYVVAADGSGAGLRHQLGIGMADHRTLSRSVSVHARADLRSALGDRKFLMGYVANDAIKGVLAPVDDGGRWLLHVPYFPERGQQPEQFTQQRCAELVRAAAGHPDLGVEVLDILPWDAAAGVADRFAHDGIFLVGDCAHVMPPSGAFGANTGIQDAHNLAWKLALRVAGRAGPRLLDTYEAERRPVAQATVTQAELRSQHRPRVGRDAADADADAEQIVPDETVQLGYSYSSTAIRRSRAARAAAGIWADGSARTGVRAPHLQLGRSGKSTIDLGRSGFVLLTGRAGCAWKVATRSLADGPGLDVSVFQIGVDDTDVDGQWRARYGPDDAAYLIRPDGFIAWSAQHYTPAALTRFRASLGAVTS